MGFSQFVAKAKSKYETYQQDRSNAKTEALTQENEKLAVRAIRAQEQLDRRKETQIRQEVIDRERRTRPPSKFSRVAGGFGTGIVSIAQGFQRPRQVQKMSRPVRYMKRHKSLVPAQQYSNPFGGFGSNEFGGFQQPRKNKGKKKNSSGGMDFSGLL